MTRPRVSVRIWSPVRPRPDQHRQARRQRASHSPAWGHTHGARAAAGAAGGVAAGGGGEVDAHLVGQRGQPGQDVGELVLLLGHRALAHGLGQLADLLGQPRHGRRHATLAVVVPVRGLHQLLERRQVHRRQRIGPAHEAGAPPRRARRPPLLVGVRGFEPPASTSRTWRANQAALHPVAGRKPTRRPSQRRGGVHVSRRRTAPRLHRRRRRPGRSRPR